MRTETGPQKFVVVKEELEITELSRASWVSPKTAAMLAFEILPADD
jgi:hypothetical protein